MHLCEDLLSCWIYEIKCLTFYALDEFTIDEMFCDKTEVGNIHEISL